MVFEWINELQTRKFCRNFWFNCCLTRLHFADHVDDDNDHGIVTATLLSIFCFFFFCLSDCRSDCWVSLALVGEILYCYQYSLVVCYFCLTWVQISAVKNNKERKCNEKKCKKLFPQHFFLTSKIIKNSGSNYCRIETKIRKTV